MTFNHTLYKSKFESNCYKTELKGLKNLAWLYMSVIPTTQEVDRKILVQAQPRQKLARPSLKISLIWWCMPAIHEISATQEA
jgi:hypothetical protein